MSKDIEPLCPEAINVNKVGGDKDFILVQTTCGKFTANYLECDKFTLDMGYHAVCRMKDNLERNISAELEPKIAKLRKQFEDRKRRLIDKAKMNSTNWKALEEAEVLLIKKLSDRPKPVRGEEFLTSSE